MDGIEEMAVQMLELEAYALASSTFVPNDSHCFVVSLDRSLCWKNAGRGWDAGETKTKVAETSAYKQWLLEFVPPNRIEKCGIRFGTNGVCHTFANRELLLGKNAASASLAPKDYVCVFFFGKYGLGLEDLKKLLTDSFDQVNATCPMSRSILDTVLRRVDNTVDDELRAWRQTAIDYASIPVDDILKKAPRSGLAVARSRMQSFIQKREAVYEQNRQRKSDLRQGIRSLIQSEADDYLDMLAGIQFISWTERNTYSQNIRAFLGRVCNSLEIQELHFQRTGQMMEDFCSLEEEDR